MRWRRSWERLLAARAVVTKALEEARKQGVIGHSLDARVQLVPSDGLRPLLEAQRARSAGVLHRIAGRARRRAGRRRPAPRSPELARRRRAGARRQVRALLELQRSGRAATPSIPELCERCLPVVRALSPTRRRRRDAGAHSSRCRRARDAAVDDEQGVVRRAGEPARRSCSTSSPSGTCARRCRSTRASRCIAGLLLDHPRAQSAAARSACFAGTNDAFRVPFFFARRRDRHRRPLLLHAPDPLRAALAAVRRRRRARRRARQSDRPRRCSAQVTDFLLVYWHQLSVAGVQRRRLVHHHRRHDPGRALDLRPRSRPGARGVATALTGLCATAAIRYVTRTWRAARSSKRRSRSSIRRAPIPPRQRRSPSSAPCWRGARAMPRRRRRRSSRRTRSTACCPH